MDVAPGTHDMTETLPAGWQLTGVACNDGNSTGNTNTRTATYNVEPGETVTCVFTNTQEGSITIVKDALPADGTDFAFDGAFGPFALDDDADPTLPDSVTFGGLLPGTYPVTETVPAGWELIGLACDDQSPVDLGAATATIGLTAGEDVTCTFTNRTNRATAVGVPALSPAALVLLALALAAAGAWRAKRIFPRT